MTTETTTDPVIPAESTARMADGTTLRTLHWAAAGEAWAAALIVHGLGEHAGRYETVAAALTAAGIDVFGYDHRGFGGSSGYRAFVERWSLLHDDLANRVEATRAERPGLPLVMYAHSLGGLIATGYVLPAGDRPLPDLLVLSSPALESTQPAWRKRMAASLTRVVPRMRIANGFAGDALSHDPAVAAKSSTDPLSLSTSTIRLGAEAFAEQDRIRALLPSVAAMPIPTYVLHGSGDAIVPMAASEVLGDKGGVTRRVWPGLRHECHHEPEQAEVLAEVVAWIRAQVPGAPGEGAADEGSAEVGAASGRPGEV
jgi:alpha-beta hydrolase superfamily lysophospholipase